MPLFSHYGDIPDISDQLSIPSLVFCFVTPLFVASRFASKLHFSKELGSDDWVILASLICGLTVNIQMIIVCQWAFGKHVKQISPPITAKTLELYFFAQIIYKVNIGLTKISILLLYKRIFVLRRFQTLVWTCIGIIVAFTIGTTFSSIFQCSPIAYAFDKTIKGGACINMAAFWYSNAVFNILSDIVIVLLPIPVIQSLQLPKKSRMALVAVFAVGLFTCVASVLRIFKLNLATNRQDVTWNSIGSSMWTVIESNLGIICACMPSLRRPLIRFFPAIFGQVSKSLYVQDGRRLGYTSTTNNSKRFAFKSRDTDQRSWINLEELEEDHGNPERVTKHEQASEQSHQPLAITKTTEVGVQRYP